MPICFVSVPRKTTYIKLFPFLENGAIGRPMRNKALMIIVLCTFLVACKPSISQEEYRYIGDENLRISFIPPQKVMRSSDLLRFNFHITHPQGSKINLLAPQNQYGEKFSLFSISIFPDGVESSTRVRSRCDVSFEPGIPGDYNLDQLTFVAQSQDEPDLQVIVAPMRFQVKSVLPNEDTKLQPIATTMVTSNESLWAEKIVVLLIILGFFVMLWFLVPRQEDIIREDTALPDDVDNCPADFVQQEKLLCRVIATFYFVPIKNLDALLRENQLDEDIQVFVEKFQTARYTPNGASAGAFVKPLQDLYIRLKTGLDL